MHIYTWGKKRHRRCPVDVECMFDVSDIKYKKQIDRFYLHKNALDDDVYAALISLRQIKRRTKAIAAIVQAHNLKSIAINCNKGENRSVSIARLLRERYLSGAVLTHLDLSKRYSQR